MKAKILFILFVFCFLCFFLNNKCFSAKLVQNSLKQIESCQEKLQLKLIRIWGGDDDTDENKFFRYPVDVTVDPDKRNYICDRNCHNIKVFQASGEYLRTIGIKGRGPGDLWGPNLLDFSSNGELLVYEEGGRRFQWFNNQGKSIEILKYKGIASWFSINSKDEIVIYDYYKTFKERNLISIINKKGKVLRTFGKYTDNSNSIYSAETLHFASDQHDNIYSANSNTPLIRKYSPDGKLLIAITFETPFKSPIEISMNSAENEVNVKRERKITAKEKVNLPGKGVSIQINTNGKKNKVGICQTIAVDSNDRIYIISQRRLLTKEEKLKGRVSILGGPQREIERKGDFDFIREMTDITQFLVFNSEGKIIAQSNKTMMGGNIHIFGNRLFFIDGKINQRILEYEISFKD